MPPLPLPRLEVRDEEYGRLLYLRLRDDKPFKTIEPLPGTLFVDLTEDDKIIGIEVLE